MKYTYLFLTVLALAFSTSLNAAEKPMLEQLKDTGKNALAANSTNINEAIVDILRGAKNAGGEIYAASKTAITKSVDFTMEQAPLVVQEFLYLQIAYALRWFLTFTLIAGLCMYASRLLKKNYEKINAYDMQEMATVFKWVLGFVAAIIMIANISTNGMTVAKVIVAPRVYLIEYVVDTVNGNNANNTR